MQSFLAGSFQKYPENSDTFINNVQLFLLKKSKCFRMRKIARESRANYLFQHSLYIVFCKLELDHPLNFFFCKIERRGIT